MAANDIHQPSSQDELSRYIQLSEDLRRQRDAAVRRQQDLEKQLHSLQEELGGLGFMQLARKMTLRSEMDNLRKKLAANKRLQEDLEQRHLHAESMKTEAIDALHLEQQEAAAVPEAPAAPAEVSTPKKARPAAPRKAAAPRKSRLRDDASLPLEEQAQRLLDHLEPYYPEHQVFALDVVGRDVRDQLDILTARSGCETTADFLASHCWQLISSAAGRALRSGKHCTPGAEPEVIRPKLLSVMQRLEKHYPDKVISRSIQHDHKGLEQDVSSLYVWLGYPSIGAMLTAYGYRYEVPSGGRPSIAAEPLIGLLKAAYAGSEKPRTIVQIMDDHPECAATLKTLQNQAPKRFGMSLRQYLTEQGILAGKK